MFTGIIEEIGTIQSMKQQKTSMELTISTQHLLSDVKLGDSIAVNGICLTVTSYTDTTFCVDIMNETLKRTSLSLLSCGSPVNLERAMNIQSRFGGHIVSGHIDGTGTIFRIKTDGIATLYTIKVPLHITRYIVEKGSITIDGISLTVVSVTEQSFSISVLPHTKEHTILHTKRRGDLVNLEVDLIGKYIEKLILPYQDTHKVSSNITKEFLLKYGF